MSKHVLISGVTSHLGGLIADKLEADGFAVTRTARSALRPEGSQKLDLTDEAAVRQAASGHDIAVLCPILSTAAPAARWLSEEGVKQLIVFSSNNVAVDHQSPVYQSLRKAEDALTDLEAKVTVLRPTMIYGYPGDGNLSRLLTMAQRLGALPCPGSGRALQQPIFVEDVGDAVSHLANRDVSPGTYTIGGPEVLSAADLFAVALKAVGRSERMVLRIPLAPLNWSVSAAERLGLKLPISTTQLQRIESDKTAAGQAPFGFVARVSVSEGLTRLAKAMSQS
ncbi:MAG: hypothetical protein HRU11_04365 [Parvularculaceae bacterium]|nr:hypothetical protein [Parvularculaceae bacterium]